MFALIKRSIPLQQKNFNYFLKPLIATRLSPTLSISNPQGIRTLYSKYSLGLEGFLLQGEELRSEIGNHEESFIKKMQDVAHNSEKSQHVFTDDLRKLVALCQEETQHLDLLIILLKQYYNQTQGFSLKPFRFGPPVMRLLYIHELTDKAVEILFNEDLTDHFTEDSAYQVVMDLLYKKECYEDVLKLMNAMKSFPKSCVTLALAANYKISTDESLENALHLNRRIYENGQRPTLRMIAFTSALALNRGKPEIAIEICSQSKSQKHYLVDNLRILAKARIGELDEVLHILEASTLIDAPKMSKFLKKEIFAPDVIEEVEKIVNDQLQLELISKFSHLKKTLEDIKFINSQTLEESVCTPIRDEIYRQKARYGRRDGFRPGFSHRGEKGRTRSDEEHFDDREYSEKDNRNV